jgi:hypothetical protein
MKKTILIIFTTLLFSITGKAQWLNPVQLTNLNTWSAQAGYIGWYGTTVNAPNNQNYGSGVQLVLPQDPRFGAQVVIPTYDNQIYYRRNIAGTWDSWLKVWSSANLNPDDYLDRSLPSIQGAHMANNFINGYTFAYASSGTPWNGSLVSYGGYGGDYDTQLNSDYGPNGGNHISFRTRNGDAQIWNPWNELYHSGNINKNDINFSAKTVNCSNVYSNGNIWAKEIRVASTNPWPDYVFKSTYQLPSLKEVEFFIDKYHHLSEFPSESDIAKEGINVGEMNKVLVKKIEELTLYLIKQNKRIEKLENQLTQHVKKKACRNKDRGLFRSSRAWLGFSKIITGLTDCVSRVRNSGNISISI